MAQKDTLTWGFMMQLGHNMWHRPQPRNRLDLKIWNESTEYAAQKGANLVLIDLGEALIYPSHPELAVEGSWSPTRMREEIARLRGLGLEPIPKLNFSACHDAWLKEYSHMVSTPEYYKVCADVIHDVCEIFGKPRLFHLGWDEERARAQRDAALLVVRNGDLWWHDFLFTVREVEKHGVQPWIWSDKIWLAHDAFLEHMPHTVMQTPWHYGSFVHFIRNDKEMLKADWPDPWGGALAFKELDEAKFDMIPCGSTWLTQWNMEAVVRFTRKHLDTSRIHGFLMAPWARCYGEKALEKNKAGADCLARAKAAWFDDREDLVIYGPAGASLAAAVKSRTEEGREPVLVTPDTKPPADVPDFDFQVRDALIDIRWGMRLAPEGPTKDGNATVVRMADGNAIRCTEFRNIKS